MRLDMDCVRDVMLACESSEPEDCPIDVEFISKFCGGRWTDRNIKYAISKMFEGALVDARILNRDEDVDDQLPFVYCLTWNGHQFLEQIRDERRWSGVKSVLDSIKNYSLAAISSVAEGMTSAAINAYFSEQK